MYFFKFLMGFTLFLGNTSDIIKGLKEDKYDIDFCCKIKMLIGAYI